MREELLRVTEEWKKLERKTEQQRIKAENYYAEHLMQLIEKVFIENNKHKVKEDVEYMIMSVGTSYEPIVLNIQLMKPKKVLFLYTSQSEKVLNRIVKYCKLDITQVYKSRVNETEPMDIYREIKRAYVEWGRPEKMYIDFTGGTKAMSAAAAMAGSIVKVQLVYVGTNDYLVDFRKPNPGSETLYYIANPLEIFGDFEIEKALVLFSQYNYSAACEKLEVLKEQVPDPALRQQLNFVYLLAKAYEAWDSLEFVKAHECISKLNRELVRDRSLHGTFLLMDMIDILQQQERILQALLLVHDFAKEKNQMGIFNNRECMISLMFTLYQNAFIREKQEKYDMATLLLYRLLEMIEQKRLANYNLNVSKMDYSQIPYDKVGLAAAADMSDKDKLEWLRDKMIETKRMMFRNFNKYYMPEQISLLDGYVLLYALNDRICMTGKMQGIDKLKRIRSMVFLRNNSIFAHGLGPVEYDEFIRFKNFVQMIFIEFCSLEGIPFEQIEKWTIWVSPLDSVYYSGMEVR